APVSYEGWEYRLVATGLTRPRGILFDQAGALLIVDAKVGVVHMTLKDGGGNCVSVDKKTTLIPSPDVSASLGGQCKEASADGRTAEPWHRPLERRQDAVCLELRQGLCVGLRRRRRHGRRH